MTTSRARVSSILVMRRVARAGLFLFAVAWAFVFIFPFLWTISTSLKLAWAVYEFPPSFIPNPIQWVNYIEIFRRSPMAKWIVNTVYAVFASTIGGTISATVVAYSFARFKYRGRDLVFLITLSTMMLPPQVTLIPRYIMFYRLGWVDSFKPLWVPSWFGGGAFSIFLIRQFLMTLPRELDEAALMDGANYLHILVRILVPLSRPVLATVVIITYMAKWSDFINPLIYIDTMDKFPLSVGLHVFRSMSMGGALIEPTYHFLMAASIVAIAPTMILFFLGQRYFVQGIVMSGIKG